MKILKNKISFKEELTFYNLLKLFRLHIKFISIFIISSLILVGVYSYFVPQVYQSSATLLPPDDVGAGLGLSNFLQSLSGGMALGNMGQSSKIQVFQEILKSREIAKLIADTLNLKNDPRFKSPTDAQLYEAVGSSLDIVLKRTGLLTITATAQTPGLPSKSDGRSAAKLAADIANAAISSLEKLNREKSVSKAKRKRIYIERVLVEKKRLLDTIDRNLENFRMNHKVIALDEQSKAVLTSAITLGADLAKAEIEMNLKLQEFEPSSPIIKLYREKVNNLKSQYQRIQRGGISTSDDFSIPLNEVPTLIRNYTNLVRSQKILEQVNLYLETQKYQEAIQEESDVSSVEVLDRAIPPATRISPNRKIMLFLSFMISTIFVLTGITFYSIYKGNIYLNKTKKKPEQDVE